MPPVPATRSTGPSSRAICRGAAFSIVALTTTAGTETGGASYSEDTVPDVPPGLAEVDQTIGAPASNPFYTPSASIPDATHAYTVYFNRNSATRCDISLTA